MRIGIVGANGFIGSALTAAVQKAGHSAVPFTRANPISGGDRYRPVSAGADQNRVAGEDAARAGAGDLDAVVWAATSSTPATIAADPGTGETELKEFEETCAALARGGDTRFILLSSGGTVYGHGHPPHREDDALSPTNDYGKFKVRMEEVCRSIFPDSTILRISNVYGPGQRARGGQGVLGHWMKALRNGGTPVIYGDPTVARDYVYIADCACAIVAATETPSASGQTINIGSGEPTSLEALAGVLAGVTGIDTAPQILEGRPYDNRSTWLATTRARDLLGWSATTPLTEGVRAMWEWSDER